MDKKFQNYEDTEKNARNDVSPDEKIRTCVLCGKKFVGWGNNPEPLKPWSEGVCCDECNVFKVIPERIKISRKEGK